MRALLVLLSLVVVLALLLSLLLRPLLPQKCDSGNQDHASQPANQEHQILIAARCSWRCCRK
jgi:hypothetical protein